MPAFDQILIYVLAALALGLIAGVILTRSLSGRHAYHNDVRWRRRFNEMQAEHELRLATLTKALRHTEEKRDTIRCALEESEETIRLLSSDRSATHDQDIVDRNNRIAELKKTLSHARAMLADAQDHESALQKQVDKLQVELAQRDDAGDELPGDAVTGENEVYNGDRQQSDDNFQTAFETAKNELADREQTISEMQGRLDEYAAQTVEHHEELALQKSKVSTLITQLDDMRQILPELNETLRQKEATLAELEAELSKERQKTLSLEQSIERIYSDSPDIAPGEASRDRAKVISLHDHPLSDDLVSGSMKSEQRIRALEIELQEWKGKYETANGGGSQPDDEILNAINGVEDCSEATAESKDDLKQIRGIGPALETALNRLGFFQYEQLARMGQHDIDQIGRHDSSLPGRIRRYKWIEQARRLQQSEQTNRDRPRV